MKPSSRTLPTLLALRFSSFPSLPILCTVLRTMLCMVLLALLLPPASTQARPTPNDPAESTHPRAIVIGFMGGNVGSHDATRNELIIANRLRVSYTHGVYFEVYENRRLEDAHQKVLDLLGVRPGHALSPQERAGARIILYGHSWGASAVVALADELRQDGVPVALTVQVDSVEKNGRDDSVIPGNVARAVNFYQPDGMLHGRTEIRAADPSRTQILGNFKVSYKAAPAECNPYPWFERIFIKTHIAIECDPVLWRRIEGLVRDSLGEPGEEAAVR